MTSLMRIILVSSALILPLGGCASVGDALDPTDWFSGDFFNGKKKLPGDRKAVFPEGVPGVSQGIPSELVKGNQQPPLENGYTVTDTQSVSPPPRSTPARTAARTDATKTDATKTDTAKTDEYQPAPREKAKPKPKPKPATAEQQPAQERQPSSVSARRAAEPQQVEQPQRSQAGSGGSVQWPDPPAQRSGGSQAGGVQWPDPPPMR
jgi:pyruvate/2-oxoglutarate dehydrogenase complex dihydrolipoamide acyltransferase (E2) component